MVELEMKIEMRNAPSKSQLLIFSRACTDVRKILFLSGRGCPP